MNANQPLVSVIMPIFNGDKFILESVQSILDQTYKNFELIIINDGSTDRTETLLNVLKHKDERISIITNQKNLRIVASLNQGLREAKGKYIARMDVDDICFPDRFRKQVDHLENHSEIGLLGTGAIFVNEKGQKIAKMQRPLSDIAIRWMSLLENPFFHPTIMIRRSVLAENNLDYRSEFQGVEDYDLWIRILEHTQGANIKNCSLKYRVHAESISSRSNDEQVKKHNLLSDMYIKRVCPRMNIPPDNHPNLVAAFNGRLDPLYDQERPQLAITYLELWQEFSSKYIDHLGYNKVKQRVMVLAAKIGLYPLFQPGWRKLIKILFSINLLWVIFVIIDLPKMIKGKVLSKYLAFARSGWFIQG